MFWHTVHPQAILATIGPVELRWYGLLIAMAVISGLFLTLYFFKKKQVDTTHVYNLFFLVLFLGLLGGRIGHVIGEWGYYQSKPSELFSIWRGGLAIHGVIFGSLLAVWLYSRRKKIKFFLLTDLMVVPLPLMQAIGRWGNYFNQELYGYPTKSSVSIPIELQFREPGYESYEFFHPLFFYESVLMLIIFGVLVWLSRRQKAGSGIVTLVYFLLFSVIRFFLDFVRLHKPMIGALSETQWLSILIFIPALVACCNIYRQEKIK